jgi:hypothetical protein
LATTAIVAAVIVLIVLAILLFALAFSSVKIVRPFQRGDDGQARPAEIQVPSA